MSTEVSSMFEKWCARPAAWGPLPDERCYWDSFAGHVIIKTLSLYILARFAVCQPPSNVLDLYLNGEFSIFHSEKGREANGSILCFPRHS